MLHNNKELFEQVILRASDYLGIETGIVEKDYFVTLILKEITSKQPEIIFKGGTSLSKCYKIIDRFSEDIDLNILCESKPTEAKRKKLKKSITDSAASLGFYITNLDETKSRRDFNKYLIDYPSVFSASYLKNQLTVETAVFFRAYPIKKMTAGSFVYDYLLANGFDSMITEYALEPFDVNVQIAERTLIDKLFAICDYYLDGAITEHSRHIYDIYKLLEIVKIDDDLRALAKQVREERKSHKTCVSAGDNVNINKILQEIIDTSAYRPDYESITLSLLFKKVEYSKSIQAVRTIVESNLFQYN